LYEGVAGLVIAAIFSLYFGLPNRAWLVTPLCILVAVSLLVQAVVWLMADAPSALGIPASFLGVLLLWAMIVSGYSEPIAAVGITHAKSLLIVAGTIAVLRLFYPTIWRAFLLPENTILTPSMWR
jgi:hypothetical protein